MLYTSLVILSVLTVSRAMSTQPDGRVGSGSATSCQVGIQWVGSCGFYCSEGVRYDLEVAGGTVTTTTTTDLEWEPTTTTIRRYALPGSGTTCICLADKDKDRCEERGLAKSSETIGDKAERFFVKGSCSSVKLYDNDKNKNQDNAEVDASNYRKDRESLGPWDDGEEWAELENDLEEDLLGVCVTA